ncbi:hypothetical protein [uncultured Tenacibaculum sp.]|uniref:hypothetical protein n=1 Tax=uncultured Tenacibaculum sp. TaxID=174713 RepID=UPI00261B3C1C|nr:hypothetical protein [uncultured Tenacibaculum sp.]
MKKYFYLVFILHLTFSCKKIEKEPSKNTLNLNNSDSTITVNDNKKILSKIINSFHKAKKIVITEKTTIVDITQDTEQIEFGNFNYRLPCLDKETFDNFLLKNQSPVKIKGNFYTQKNIVILENQQINEVLKNSIYTGWKKFYETYGEEAQGLLTLSRIGFNKKKNKALLYYSNQSNNTNGGGYLLVFKKIKNDWEICSSTQVWIA